MLFWCRIHTGLFHPEWLEHAGGDTPSRQLQLPENCEDFDSNCKGWSESGVLLLNKDLQFLLLFTILSALRYICFL